MSVIVLSCGRSGGSMVTEILATSSYLDPDPDIDNRELFKQVKYPKDYLVKGPDTIHYNYDMLNGLMISDPDMQVIWPIRHPYDMTLSKIRRGQGQSAGGDKESEGISADATLDGAVKNIYWMLDIYKRLKADYPNRLYLIKMEDIIINFDITIMDMCAWLEIPYDEDMINFPKRMRNKYKRKRYSILDTNQVNLWKRFDDIYDGFFRYQSAFNLNHLAKELNEVARYFDYECIICS